MQHEATDGQPGVACRSGPDRVWASSDAHTPGIDGIDKRRMQNTLDQHLANLRVDLLNGTYCPKPVRRIYIPKANGKQRPLGIPTLSISRTGRK